MNNKITNIVFIIIFKYLRLASADVRNSMDSEVLCVY